MLISVPSDGMTFAFHSFSGCKEHECECTCAYTCTYMLCPCCPLLKESTSLIFVPQAQTGKDHACGAAVSELQAPLSSKHRLELAVNHHTTSSVLYTDPVPPPTPPSEDWLKKNFWALQSFDFSDLGNDAIGILL